MNVDGWMLQRMRIYRKIVTWTFLSRGKGAAAVEVGEPVESFCNFDELFVFAWKFTEKWSALVVFLFRIFLLFLTESKLLWEFDLFICRTAVDTFLIQLSKWVYLYRFSMVFRGLQFLNDFHSDFELN